MPAARRALIASSDPQNSQDLAQILTQCGLDPIASNTWHEAKHILAHKRVQVVFCEDGLPDAGVVDILNETRLATCNVPVVVISRSGGWEEYLRAMRGGAFDVIARPCRPAEVERIVDRALRALAVPC